MLEQHDQIHFQNVFVDGTKIEANANRYTFVWKKSILKYQERLLQKHDDLIQTICRDYQLNAELPPQDILQELKNLLQLKQVQMVTGRGHHKTPLQRDMDQLEHILNKLEDYQTKLSRFGSLNSFSKTDTDATFMHLKEDHMKNGQLKPAYNI